MFELNKKSKNVFFSIFHKVGFKNVFQKYVDKFFM